MKRLSLGILIFSLFLGVWLVGVMPEARAYCVYNRTEQTIPVFGERCPRCYKGFIKPGKRACCPGDKKGCRGTTWVSVLTGGKVKELPVIKYPVLHIYYHYCGKQVDAHGYAIISKKKHRGGLILPGHKKQKEDPIGTWECDVFDQHHHKTWSGKMKGPVNLPKDD